MTYVICEPCNKDYNCVAVCPVDCIYEGEKIVLINPDECIDCGACQPECPTSAIFPEDDVPPQWKDFIALNADAFKGDSPPPKAEKK